MYQLKKEELLSLLENMRQIRQKAGEMISFLEHMMQLQPISPLRELPYNPDDYLENTAYDELDQVQQSPGLRPCWRNNDDHLAGGSLNPITPGHGKSSVSERGHG